MIICPKCNHQVEGEAKFCDKCGTALTNLATNNEALANEATNNEAIVDEVSRPIKNKFSKKTMIVSSIGAIAIIVTILILFLSRGENSNTDYALYIKDDQIYYADTKKIEPSEMSTNLFDFGEGLVEYTEAVGNSVGAITMLSKDGEIIFFPDKMSSEDYGFTLYCRYVDQKDVESEKIDSDVVKYSVNESASLITYLKDFEDGVLYQSNLTDREKIDSNVSKFYVSDDGNKIIYVNTEGSIYLKNNGADKVKIDGDASIEYVSEDLSTVYYLKDETLYKKNENEDKVKISSNVASVVKIYNTGEMYFVKSNSTEISLLDYVQDDLKDADDMIIRPESVDYPYSSNYDTRAEYDVAKLAYAEYETAYDNYYDKLDRDILREDLAETFISQSKYSLFYYNELETLEITDAFIYDGYYDSYYDGYYYNDYAIANEAAVIIFKTYNELNTNKVKLSEINSISDVEEIVYEALDSSSELHVSVGAVTSDIEQTEAQNFSIDSAGNTIYFLDNINNEKSYGDLYKITISKESAQKAELYDSNVSTSMTRFISEDNYTYYKDVKDMLGELYINKESIDYDVSLYHTVYDDNSDAIAYFTDWNSEKSYGTLKVQNPNGSSKIADDVHAYKFTPGGDVLYLYDYSSDYFNGELYLYGEGKNNEKIDDDVSAIIPVYTSVIKEINYGF